MITSRLPSAALTTAAVLSFAFAGQSVAATAHESFTSLADSVASDGFNNLTAGRITTAQLIAGLVA
ncbi:MAG: PEP-CTERM sorting domain-containing protein, partial [Methyloversatilis sp.]|nr:PEP-CTERM sorting domain-containing protein [Methyloversatilis sp.]